MIQVETTAESCQVQPRGELTIYQAEAFSGQLLPLIAANSALVIDLSDVSDIDTSCAQVLMVARRACLAEGKAFSLVNHSQPVIDAFETLGLVAWFGDPVVLKVEAGTARPPGQDSPSAEGATS